MGGDGNDDCCWDAFGSDDDDSDDGIVADAADTGGDDNWSSPSLLAAASAVSLFLAKNFLHVNSKVPIGQRRIAFANEEEGIESQDHNVLKETLSQRGFTDLSDVHPETEASSMWWDCVILVCTEQTISEQQKDRMYKNLVPGGLLLVVSFQNKNPGSILNSFKADTSKWNLDSSGSGCAVEQIFADDNIHVCSLLKTLCQVQDRSCLWLSSSHSLSKERVRLGEAIVPLSAHEIRSTQLLEPSLVKAVQKMQQYGYVILPRLLNAQECREWGQGVLRDLHSAAKILLEREGVNILNPHESQKDPQSYRELSMREDLRMDLRDGPSLRQLRGDNNNKPIVLQSDRCNTDTDKDTNANPFFRLHPSILEIVRRTMNPKKGNLYKGNFGRHNFSGSGPDGSYQDIRLGAIGGIISLPGSADQAIHADCPHLFEHATLPAHYINAFALGCAGDPLVGCTAFVHGSHRIEFTAEYLAEDNDSSSKDHNKVFEFLVRPQLELGDVVLFDCRVLHFGLANMSRDVERTMLYGNMTHAWFHDPKNWDNHHPIFGEESLS